MLILLWWYLATSFNKLRCPALTALEKWLISKLWGMYLFVYSVYLFNITWWWAWNRNKLIAAAKCRFLYFLGYVWYCGSYNLVLFHAGYLFLDRGWSGDIPLFICHRESSFLHFQPHTFYILDNTVCLSNGSFPQKTRMVCPSGYISCKSSLFSTTGCSASIWDSS